MNELYFNCIKRAVWIRVREGANLYKELTSYTELTVEERLKMKDELIEEHPELA